MGKSSIVKKDCVNNYPVWNRVFLPVAYLSLVPILKPFLRRLVKLFEIVVSPCRSYPDPKGFSWFFSAWESCERLQRGEHESQSGARDSYSRLVFDASRKEEKSRKTSGTRVSRSMQSPILGLGSLWLFMHLPTKWNTFFHWPWIARKPRGRSPLQYKIEKSKLESVFQLCSGVDSRDCP